MLRLIHKSVAATGPLHHDNQKHNVFDAIYLHNNFHDKFRSSIHRTPNIGIDRAEEVKC